MALPTMPYQHSYNTTPGQQEPSLHAYTWPALVLEISLLEKFVSQWNTA